MESKSHSDKYKLFGVNIDPCGDLDEKVMPDGDIKATYKGGNIPYDDMIDILEERTTNISKGRPVGRQMFSGFNFKEINHG